jgi:hypothetical protein
MAVENASRLIQDFALALQPLGLTCAVYHDHQPAPHKGKPLPAGRYWLPHTQNPRTLTTGSLSNLYYHSANRRIQPLFGRKDSPTAFSSTGCCRNSRKPPRKPLKLAVIWMLLEYCRLTGGCSPERTALCQIPC